MFKISAHIWHRPLIKGIFAEGSYKGEYELVKAIEIESPVSGSEGAQYLLNVLSNPSQAPEHLKDKVKNYYLKYRFPNTGDFIVSGEDVFQHQEHGLFQVSPQILEANKKRNFRIVSDNKT